MSHANFQYSVTCQVPDLIVVACLRAIAFEVQKGAGGAPNISSSGTGAKEWQESQQVKFYFTETERRIAFINHAARLLQGNWTLLAMSDNDPAPQGRSSAD
ncbi:MAG: hypothetical protein HY289_04810 [Planctomycetes bacterium]|nr:hypothetical protein [Planctomycetota bacterium]